MSNSNSRAKRWSALRLSRWLPKTSFGRTALSVGIILLLAQFATGLLSRIYVIGPSANHTGRLLGQKLALGRALLHANQQAGANPQQTTEIERLLLQSGNYLISRSPPTPTSAWPKLLYYRQLHRAVIDILGPGSPLLLVREGQQTLWTELAQQHGWVGIPIPRPEATLGPAIAIWFLLVVLAALVVAAFTVRHLDRPLRRLADAARRFGRGQTPAPLPPTGAEEIRSLTDSFNHMVADLSQQEEQRRLFLAGISHDLRTPLTRQRLTLEMMNQQDPALKDEALHNIDDMEAIVGQFMHYLQGEQQESRKTIDLNQLLRDIARPYQQRGLIVELELSDATPLQTLPLRPQAMKRLLCNLLDNAQRYAGDAAITLQTEASGAATDNGHFCVRVLDRGPGIPEPDLRRALQPYIRLSGDSSAPGSGLGLAIVARIAASEGLALSLSNRPGGGLAVQLCR